VAAEAVTRADPTGHAAASTGHKRCPTDHRKIVAVSRLVVVTYHVKVTTTASSRTEEPFTLACWRSTGRERRISGASVVIAGAWVGYHSEVSGFNHDNDYPVTSVATDVRTGRSRDLDFDGGISDVVAHDMVLKPNGSFAILGREHQLGTPVVAALDRDGGRTLSTSRDVVEGSLVLHGGSVWWLEGSARRTARLR
jgi:hypothetical protein